MRWTDSLGDNILITTKRIIQHVDGPNVLQRLEKQPVLTKIKETEPQRAYHYLVINDSAVFTWEAIGILKLCDKNVNFSRNWFVITDLDNNSIAEVWLIYRNDCPEGNGDMKIVMFENDIKYSATGKFEESQFLESYFDQNFNAAPES
jgi:hypothetical protein